VKNYRAAFERWFKRFGYFVADNPLKTLLFSLAIAAPFVVNLPKASIDASTEGFFFPDDPAIVKYNAFRDAYGREERAVFMLGPADIFTPATIEKMRRIHQKIDERVPYLDEATSLINARNTRGEGDELIVEELFENQPQTDEEWAAIKKRALNNEFYKNLYISEDGRYATIVVSTLAFAPEAESANLLDDFDALAASEGKTAAQYLNNEQNGEFAAALEKIALEEDSAELPVMLAGSPIVTDSLKRYMQDDIRTFMGALVLVILLALFATFRRISGAIFPLLVSALSLACTIGLMAFLGVSVKIPTQVLPSLLLAVGVGAATHLVSMFYLEIDAGKSKREAIANALGHSGLAVAMTALTTIAGIGSFAAAELAPIADVGRYAAFGVALSLFFTIVFLPALLAIAPIKARARKPFAFADRALTAIANFSVANDKAIAIVFATLIVVALAAVTQARLSHAMLSWFPQHSQIRQASEAIDRVMGGSVSAEIVVDFKDENALYDPARLATMDKALKEAQGFETEGYFVGKAFGISEILKEINRALNENREEFYAIADNRDLIAQELLLFSNSGSDDPEEVANARFSQARLTHKLPFGDAVGEKPLLDRLEALYQSAFEDAEITLTGLSPLLVRVIYAALHSMATSYATAIVTISLMMIALLANIRLGALMMAPNLAPILFGMALMVALEIPFDIFMMLTGSIIISLAVDDTIHFAHNFRRYYGEYGDTLTATKQTFLTTGRAMCVTTVVMSAGFFTYMFATMSNIVNFGLISGVCIVLALLADLLFSPALVSLYIKFNKGVL
jgi:predicted RND superfamily exporter protein